MEFLNPVLLTRHISKVYKYSMVGGGEAECNFYIFHHGGQSDTSPNLSIYPRICSLEFDFDYD